jgi:hypothetical protein
VSRPISLAALVLLASAALATAKDLPEPLDTALDHLSPGTVQAFHLQWGWGDRGGETVDVMVQIQGERKGFVRAKQTQFAGLTSVEVLDRQAPLTAADIHKIRTAAEANDFWTITEQYGPAIIHNKDGSEAVLLCQGPMTLTGFDQGRHHGVDACAAPGHSERAWRFGQTVLAVARGHTPGFAQNPRFRGL